MHPNYMWEGSYPYHANPMHYAPNDDPRAKEISSHMKMDPSTLSPPYQPWPYGVNYGYPGPQECHGGYNHGYFGGGPYSFRPPYPYYPPPPPSSYHTHGFYPPFPGAYPAYSFPPPHYSVEQPRYDYDKNTHGSHHCCGCNHQEDEKKLTIEPKPEIEKKTSDSLIPLFVKDYPYPIMWVPPGFMNTESKTKEKEKHSHDHVPLKPLEPSKQGGNGETNQDQQGGDDNRLPFPIFWFPSKNNEMGEKNVDLVAQKGSPFSRIDDRKINDEAERETGSKPAIQKVIPVKQLETEEEKKSLKNIETKAKSGSVEKTDNGIEGKASPKTPKLRPICLRIDPLPRKKNSSRSPSPPGDKKRSNGSSIDKSKSSQQQQEAQLSEGLKKSNEDQSDMNMIKVVESDSFVDPCEKGVVCKAEKKKLSENEAALIIQSVFRGFQVRKSKPITKLKQICEVGKQVIELRKRIQEVVESSSSICVDDKQKLIIGETIMSLLLKLDTIQGLHPVVREVRKCVAKELVGLQEKLDSIKSETPIQDNTKREDDNNDKGIHDKSEETQFKVLEGGGLTNQDLQNEESSAEVKKNEVEVSVETKQPVNDDDDDDDVIQDKFGEIGYVKVVDDVEAENIENVDDVIQDKLGEIEDVKVVDDMEAENIENVDDVIQDKLGEIGDVKVVGDMEAENIENDDDVSQDKFGEIEDLKVVGDMEAENIGNVNDDDDDVIQDKCGEIGDVKVVGDMEIENIEKVECDTRECAEGFDMKMEKDCEVEVEEGGMVEDVKVMEEQMSVIRELTERVRDLEKKLLKNNNKKKMKKVSKKKKGRRSHGCILEEVLS